MKKLNYHLDKNIQTPLYLQLYQQIKLAICQQKLIYGEALPSKNKLKDYLKISRNTVEGAYNQLSAEGYIQSKPRKGFFVCFKIDQHIQLHKKVKKLPHLLSNKSIKFDLNPHKIDSRRFPFQAWKKCGRLCYNSSKRELLHLGDPKGDLNLRLEIANYLSASRGVNCVAEQIIIAAGVESCLQQLILLFNQIDPKQHFIYAMESLGYEKVEKLLHLHDKPVVKLPINSSEQGINLAFLEQQRVNVAYLTPSHLYPFGQVMSISQRHQLLEWANAAPNRYIIEDDYDSEFRYKGKPIPSLQSLDFHERVIYFGSFSKLIMPVLRTSFMVLPENLLQQYEKYCNFSHSTVSRFEQQRLANFMQQGEFERHIHRMRTAYRRKMELLCSLLHPYKNEISYYGEHSGVYLLIELLDEHRTSTELSQIALQNDIQVYPIEYSSRHLFVLGFGDLTETELESAVKKLLIIWGYEV
ncbi:PLP-dependent aminotransferase family protein [Seminibacterium arietis]|uniref:PLP-dependent aminotransferase family protein n=1 Tax=Seminibacterium arietis TaxID=1173502 RepID=A0ABW3I7P7_9PAST